MDSRLPAEIWLVVADHFLSKATLRALCLTSKALNHIFTPVLYRDVFTKKDIATWSRDRKNLSELGSDSHLRFTRHFDLGHTPRSCTPATEVLEKLFEEMTGLMTCRVWALPDDAYRFCHPSVTHLSVSANYSISGLPPFKNLQCLDIRCDEGSIDIPSLATSLVDLPALKALALAEKVTTDYFRHGDPLSRLAFAFEEVLKSRGSPGSRLQLQHLCLSPTFIIDLPQLHKYDTRNRLSILTDLSKLYTFHYLNKLRYTPGVHQLAEDFDGRFLQEATNLEKFSVDIVCRGVDSFVQALTTGSPKNRTLYELEVIHGISPQFRLPTTGLTCGWRVLHLKGDGRWHEVLLNCPELEELSIPDGYITFGMINFRLFPLLRIFTTTCETYMSERRVAVRFFRQHQRAMQDQGLISQLRYVGVNDKVYARGQQIEDYRTYTLNVPIDKEPVELDQLGLNPYGSGLTSMSSRRALRSRYSKEATVDDKTLDEDASDCLTELEEEAAQSFYLAGCSQTHQLIPPLYRTRHLC